MNERDYALRDAAMADFVDSYFNARPQLIRTRHEECLVEAGFKAAWKPAVPASTAPVLAFFERLRDDLLAAHAKAHDSIHRALLQSAVQQVAPSVPEEWREVMAELAADLQAACDAEHPHREQYQSVMRKYQNDMEIVERARALLQSADHSDKSLEMVTPEFRTNAKDQGICDHD